MRTRLVMALMAGACLGACLIEPVTFTPLADDTASPDASGCGDNTRQGAEVCDGTDLGDADCSTAGSFTAGTLGCDVSCEAFDTSECSVAPTVPSLRMPMNDTYMGNMSVAGSRRPSFIWEPSSVDGSEAITYEFELSIDATFATGVTTISTTMTSHQPAADLGGAPTAPVGARYFWRVRACSDGFCSATSSTWSVSVGRVDRDFNGDGYADIVVGAPYHDAGGVDAGRAYVYYGGAGGTFDAVSNGTLTGAAAGDYFGWSVTSAGDVNGDGFCDIVVGSYGSNVGGSDAGRADVYLGGPGFMFDAVADGVLSGAGGGDRFGWSVASAGDVNGDGFADIVVGADRNDAGGGDAGRAYIYFGGAGGTFDESADGSMTGSAAVDFFGYSVASAGDVNGDGFADIVVGAVGDDTGGALAGSASIYFGGPGGAFNDVAEGILQGSTGDFLGNSVASASDVNGDGYSDIVVGAYGSDSGGADAGRAYLYFGQAGATFDGGADGSLVGAAAGDRFGISVATAGDVNGDGFADVVIGANENDASGTDAGRAYVYLGGQGATFDAAADGTLSGGSGENFGTCVAPAGDVNGDGFADIVVGAPLSPGRAYAYLGAFGVTFDSAADGTLTEPDAGFGRSVASSSGRLPTNQVASRNWIHSCRLAGRKL